MLSYKDSRFTKETDKMFEWFVCHLCSKFEIFSDSAIKLFSVMYQEE